MLINVLSVVFWVEPNGRILDLPTLLLSTCLIYWPFLFHCFVRNGQSKWNRSTMDDLVKAESSDGMVHELVLRAWSIAFAMFILAQASGSRLFTGPPASRSFRLRPAAMPVVLPVAGRPPLRLTSEVAVVFLGAGSLSVALKAALAPGVLMPSLRFVLANSSRLGSTSPSGSGLWKNDVMERWRFTLKGVSGVPMLRCGVLWNTQSVSISGSRSLGVLTLRAGVHGSGSCWSPPPPRSFAAAEEFSMWKMTWCLMG